MVFNHYIFLITSISQILHTQTPYRYIHIVGIIGRLCVENQGSECCASVKFEMLQSTALPTVTGAGES